MSTIEPAEWISLTLMSFITSFMNGKILIAEYKKYKSGHIKTTIKWFKWFSALCMISGTIYTIIRLVRFLPIFCSFSTPLLHSLLWTQGTFMGFYQLSRLHHCFSQNRTFTKKGYPNWLFTTMYIIGTLTAVNGWIYPWLYHSYDLQCGIDDKFQYFPKEFIRDNPTVAIWTDISTLIYLIWDFTILFLYAVKVYSFGKIKYNSQQIEVHGRISSILKRVLILTFLYESSIALSSIIGIIRNNTTNKYGWMIIHIMYISSFSFSAVIINFSMFLMQQHNDAEYDEFYQILRKLHIFRNIKFSRCICCQSSIEQETVENTVNTCTSPEITSTTVTNEGGADSIITNINTTQCGGVRIGRVTLTGNMHHTQNTLTPGANDDITFTMNEEDSFDSQRTTTSELDRNYQKTRIVIARIKKNINNKACNDENGWK